MQFGDYRVEIVPDTEFRLDGGAMFGVVPRNLWSRVCPPDDQNRIRMNMNCLFIETASDRILIETGIGEKWSAKHSAMYGITRERAFADSLRTKTGFGPEAITIVINTHLHFDHAGGNTILSEHGNPVPAFPNARYFFSRAEFEHAEQPSERDRASYLPENWRPAYENGQVELKAADYEVVPGLSMETHAGHNRSMQCWRLDRGGKRSSVLRILFRCGHTSSSRGLWVTTFFLWRRWKLRSDFCRRPLVRVGSACSITIRMSRCVS
jgi:glyoxylase-like metal-dependent hydrolase (beta-lactamase superfamily II)